MHAILLAALVGCTRYVPEGEPTDGPVDSDDDTDDTSRDDDDTAVTPASKGDTAVTIPLDCTLPQAPRPFTTVQDFTRAEDFDFDFDGYHVSIQNRDLVGNDLAGDFKGVIATGLNNPNGVILSPDKQTLYVGSFGDGMVYAIDRISDFEFDTPRILYDVVGPNGGFDGINVDACGNVYVTEYTTGRVYRVTPDGAHATMIADLPSSWVPNMRWGNDIGGWDHDILYVSDRNQARLFALETGIPGKKQVTMP